MTSMQNCAKQHDPALCLCPLKDGTIYICALCGGRHLVEDGVYFSPQLFLRHVWHARQCRPPIQTRISLAAVRISQLPNNVQPFIVVPVQIAGFPKISMDHETARSCRYKNIPFLWKKCKYDEGLKAICRHGTTA